MVRVAVVSSVLLAGLVMVGAAAAGGAATGNRSGRPGQSSFLGPHNRSGGSTIGTSTQTKVVVEEQ